MMRSYILVGILAVFLSAFVGGFMYLVNDADREQRQRETDWLTFSMQHHCRIVNPSSFWKLQTTWQCDGGFQVQR